MANSGLSRRQLLRAGLLAGAAATAPSVLSGCTALGFGNTLDKVRSEGVIRAGIAGEVPYSFVNERGMLVGGIGSLHRAIFARMDGITVEPVVVPFGDLLDGLDAGSFDVVAAGMFITAERCGQAIFSDPVYCAPSSFLVPEGNPRGLSGYRSVARTGASLAVLSGAVESDYATEAGVDTSRLHTIGNQNEGLRLVASGEVDAFALTALSLRALLDRAGRIPAAQNLPGVEPAPSAASRVEMLEPFVPTINGQELLGCGGAAFRPTDTELRDAFSDELSAIQQAGLLLQLMRPWGFSEAELPHPDVTSQRLCRVGGVSGTDIDPVPR